MEELIDIFVNIGSDAAKRHLRNIETSEAYDQLRDDFRKLLQNCANLELDAEEDWDEYDRILALDTHTSEDILNYFALLGRIEKLDFEWESADARPMVHAVRLARSLRSLDITSWDGLTEDQTEELLAACDQVQFLHLRGKWPKVPAGISRCQNLRMLDASHCQVAELSPGISACSSLRILCLKHNALTQFPTAICNAPSLEEIDLNHNQIKGALPSELAQAPRLRKLDIGWNGVHDITALDHCTNLKSLQIELCPITDLPLALKGLEALTCSSGQEQVLGPWISNHQTLRSLIIVLDATPHLDLGFLEYLSGLSTFEIYPEEGYTSSVNMTSLEALATQGSLELLSIIGGQLEQIPDAWEALRSLKRLFLAHNRITLLPRWLGNLVELEDVKLWNNQIQEVPHELLMLPKLRFLKLAENPIPPEHMDGIKDKVGNRITL